MLHPAYALKATGYEAEYGASLAKAATADFLNHYAGGEATYLAALRHMAATLYGAALQRSGRTYFLDKTPRYYFIIPELQRLFPKAKFVFLLRNPLAVLNSILTTWVRGDWLGLSHCRQDLLTAPRRLIEGIQRLGTDAVVVRYEDLVSRPVDCVSQVCDRLGLTFSSELLSYGDRPAPQGRMGDSDGIHLHREPSADSLEKWRGLAAHAQTRHFAHAYLRALGPELMEQLGYDFAALRAALGPERQAGQPMIVPWGIALRHSADWSLRERLIAELALPIQRKGRFFGALEAFGQAPLRLLRSFTRR